MAEEIKFKIDAFNVHFGDVHALKNLNLQIKSNEIFTVIGPANSGKSSFLYSLNRLNDLKPGFRLSGQIFMDGTDIYKQLAPEALRCKVGIVFALPMPLPGTIFENIVYGPRRQGVSKRSRLEEIVETSLKSAYLWEEVKDRLDAQALNLSGGQQQRLCIARMLALSPEVLLFDEPTSGLDPLSTAKVEEAMLKLKEKYTIVLVTNNVAQAARVGDRTAFFLMAEMVELNETKRLFTTPADKRTDDYITGKFG